MSTSTLAFVTLFLSLTFGPHDVEVLVSDEVAKVEMWLDGEMVGWTTAPRWTVNVDFGRRLEPHHVRAVALDSEGEELATAEQWVNLPTPTADADVVVVRQPDGSAHAALTWTNVMGTEPESVALSLDGYPIPVEDPSHIPLPPHDLEQLHFMRAELLFDRNVSVVKEVTFGGSYGDELSTDLTAVPVELVDRKSQLPEIEALQAWFEVGRQAASIAAVDEGPAEVVVIRDPQVQGAIERIVAGNAARRSTGAGLRRSFQFEPLRRLAQRGSESGVLLALHGPGAIRQVDLPAPVRMDDTTGRWPRLLHGDGTSAASARRGAADAGRRGSRSRHELAGPQPAAGRCTGTRQGTGRCQRVVTRGRAPLPREPACATPCLVALLPLRFRLGRGRGHLESGQAARRRQQADRCATETEDRLVPRQIPAAGRPAQRQCRRRRVPGLTRTLRYTATCLFVLLLSLLPAVAAGQQVVPDEPDAESEVLGGAAAFSLIDAERPRVWIPAGTPLFEEPDVASGRLATIDASSEIEAVESRGEWHQIHYQGRVGWVQPDLPLGRRGLDVTPMPGEVAVDTPGFVFEPPSRRIALAKEALGLEEPNGRIGPWGLLTDVGDEELLGRLDLIAGGLAATYRERFDLEPAAADEQVVVLFATEEQYRPFESKASHLAHLGARGHASADLAALFLGDDTEAEATSLLVHELTHLMNRGALGAEPPPWVEEGIANDLAYSVIDRRGRLRVGSVNGERTAWGDRRSGMTIQYSLGVAALAELLRARARRRSTPLEELVALEKMSFLAPARRQLHYIESAFLVRFLLEADRSRHAAGFRRYLNDLGMSDDSGAIDLLDYLDTDWRRLDRDFENWLELQAGALLR